MVSAHGWTELPVTVDVVFRKKVTVSVAGAASLALAGLAVGTPAS